MKIRNERGMTLIEALVAVTMLASVICAVGMLTTAAYAVSDGSRCREHAMLIADQEIEWLRAMSYDDMVRTPTWAVMRSRDGVYYPVVGSVQKDSPSANMSQISITVSWTGRGGARRAYTAQTILTSIQR